MLVFVALAAIPFVACRKKAVATDAGASVAIASAPAPTDSAWLARVLDAGAPKPHVEAGPPPILDGGVSACRLLAGPLQQPFTGPAAIEATEGGLQIFVHHAGVARAITVAIESPATAAAAHRTAIPGTADRTGKPACEVAGPYVFCADTNGDVHRGLRAQASDQIVAHSDPGTRVAAAAFAGGHAGVAYLAVRRTSEGILSEAFMKVDDGEPLRISEDGAGATELALASRGKDVIALLVDARRAMAPVHARVLSVDEKGHLVVGADAVVYVGGGSDHQMHAALGVDAEGNTYGLLPNETQDGFGLALIHIDVPPKVDSPSTFSAYPNGIDGAPVAATHGGHTIYVARVRPLGPEVGSTRALEIGRVDIAGKYEPLGIVPTNGSVLNVAAEVDRFGALWLYYTDGAGSWLERRMCPG